MNHVLKMLLFLITILTIPILPGLYFLKQGVPFDIVQPIITMFQCIGVVGAIILLLLRRFARRS